MAKKTYLSFFLCLALILGFPSFTFAESNYVLPYPSYMPGNFLYKPRLILNKLSAYIYFGDFGRFDYSLKESDHYLVEAKTLFEYKQYLLGVSALKKSDSFFMTISPNLENARKSGKNTSEKEVLLREATLKHMETLGDLKNKLPKTFNWSPEKSESTPINLSDLIDKSIQIRSSAL